MDKIVSSVLDRSSPDLKHSFPLTPKKRFSASPRNEHGQGNVIKFAILHTLFLHPLAIEHSNLTQSLRGRSITKFIHRMALSGRGHAPPQNFWARTAPGGCNVGCMIGWSLGKNCTGMSGRSNVRYSSCTNAGRR